MAKKKEDVAVEATGMLGLVLANLNKTDKEKNADKAADQIEDFKVGLQGEISHREVTIIPQNLNKINTLKRDIAKQTKKAADATYNILGVSLQSYLYNRNEVIATLNHMEEEVATLVEANKGIKEEIKDLKELLGIFSAK